MHIFIFALRLNWNGKFTRYPLPCLIFILQRAIQNDCSKQAPNSTILHLSNILVINDEVGQHLITQRRNNLHPFPWRVAQRGHRKLDCAHGFCDKVILEDILWLVYIPCSKDLYILTQQNVFLSYFFFAWKTMLLICSIKRGKFRSNPCHLVEYEQHQLPRNNIFLR